MEQEIKAGDVLAYIKDHLSPMIAEKVTEAVDRARKEAGTPAAIAAAQNFAERQADERRQATRAKTATGRFIRAMAATQNNLPKAADFARRTYGDEMVAKALAESTFVDGGALVPINMSDEVTTLLRAQVAVRALGAREVPMPNGNLTMPYVNTGVTPFAVAENQNVASSGMTFGQLNMRAHKIRAVVPISNDLIQDSSPQADEFVQQDMTQAIRFLEDQYFIRGTGTANTPRGLKYLAATTLTATNVAGGAGGATNTEMIKDLMLLVQAVESYDIVIEKGGFIFGPRSKFAFLSAKDTAGNFYFKDEMARGTLWGYPFRSTTTMPANLNDVGSLSSKETEVIFADFDKILIGTTGGLTIQVIPFGAYNDGSTVISGISTDQTVVAGTIRSDIGARYRGKEIAYLKGVTWGA